jgi:hypothetical protein
MNKISYEEGESMKNQYLLNIAEAAECLGIGRDKLRELCYTDPTIPKVKIGVNTTKINMKLMEQWIDQATREGRSI